MECWRDFSSQNTSQLLKRERAERSQQPKHQPAAENRASGENHPVQNTNEILSRYLLYEAGNDEAAETGESYAARDYKASEISALSEAEREKASEHMKL
jgi:hypothetical protein